MIDLLPCPFGFVIADTKGYSITQTSKRSLEEMEHIFGGDSSTRIKDDETGIAAPHSATEETPQNELVEEKTTAREPRADGGNTT